MAQALKKNLRIMTLTAQMVLVEDVIEWKVDSLGVNITTQETIKVKEGETFVDRVTTHQLWFNSAGIIKIAEEFVKA